MTEETGSSQREAKAFFSLGLFCPFLLHTFTNAATTTGGNLGSHFSGYYNILEALH